MGLQLRDGGKYLNRLGREVTIVRATQPFIFNRIDYRWLDEDRRYWFLDDGTFIFGDTHSEDLIEEVHPPLEIDRENFKKRFQAAYTNGVTVEKALDIALSDEPVPQLGQLYKTEGSYWILARSKEPSRPFQALSLTGKTCRPAATLAGCVEALYKPTLVAESIKAYVAAGGKFEL